MAPDVLPPKPQIKRDPKRARSSILRSGTVLFARLGPDGAGVEQIALHAGFSKRMVYHYFGSKQGLYRAVLQAEYGRLRTISRDIVRHEGDLAGLLDGLVYEYFSYLQQNPEFVQLLSWENSRGALGLKQIDISGVIEPIVRAVSNALSNRAYNNADIDIDVDVRYLVMSCLALCSYYFTNRHTLSVTFAMDLDDPIHMQKWLEHVRQLIVSGLKSRCTKE